MRKRTLALVGILILVNSLIFGEWVALYEGWEGHPRIGGGLIPTSLSIGLAHQWATRTELHISGNAGYHERLLWQDPISGSIRSSNPLIYDHMDLNLGVGVMQRVGKHRVSATIAMNFERPLDSIITDTVLESGKVLPLDDWDPGTVYGQIDGWKFIASAGYHYDGLTDTRTSGQGIRGSLVASHTLGVGTWSIIGDAVGMMTVYEQKDEGRNLFSIVLADKLIATYVFGSTITLTEQERTSFGSKIRGFGTFQYPTSFSIANQFDIRINGPEAIYKGIFPRLDLFVDVGYGIGYVGNSTVWADGFLASAGGSLFFTLGPVMDFGYQMAYLLAGDNPEYPGVKMVGQLVAHLSY